MLSPRQRSGGSGTGRASASIIEEVPDGCAASWIPCGDVRMLPEADLRGPDCCAYRGAIRSDSEAAKPREEALNARSKQIRELKFNLYCNYMHRCKFLRVSLAIRLLHFQKHQKKIFETFTQIVNFIDRIVNNSLVDCAMNFLTC